MHKKLIPLTAAFLALCITGCSVMTDEPTASGAPNGSDITETTAADSTADGETTAQNAESTADTTAAAASTETSAAADAATATTAAKPKETESKTDTEDYQYRISDITGIWYEDGTTTLDPRTLTVNADGTFSLQYKGGGALNGTVKVTAEEHPDGTRTLWFNFYDEGGDLWTGFPESQTQVQNDLYSGQDGELHFFRADTLSEGDTEDVPQEPRFKGDDYVGVWGCGRCTLIVAPASDGYDVQIQWASSAADGSFWNYHCYYDPSTWHLHCNGSGTRTDYEYAGEDTDPVNTVQYTDGSAEFWLSDDGWLSWIDYKESAGDGMNFSK